MRRQFPAAGSSVQKVKFRLIVAAQKTGQKSAAL
jgi:hypothetical protein